MDSTTVKLDLKMKLENYKKGIKYYLIIIFNNY